MGDCKYNNITLSKNYLNHCHDLMPNLVKYTAIFYMNLYDRMLKKSFFRTLIE